MTRRRAVSIQFAMKRCLVMPCNSCCQIHMNNLRAQGRMCRLAKEINELLLRAQRCPHIWRSARRDHDAAR